MRKMYSEDEVAKLRSESYRNGYRQGEFEMMIELIHGSYEREDKLIEIRKEIIERYTN